MTKKTVLILFGGESAEHDISIQSATNIVDALDRERVNPVLCYIDPDGAWWHVQYVYKPDSQPERAVVPLIGQQAVQIGDTTVPIDVLFPVLHGTNGEDGTIQGMARLLHVPIVGCGMDGSLLCMDKIIAKQLLQISGITIVPGRSFHAGDTLPSYTTLRGELGDTLFIKPARQGSSVGVSRVTSAPEYDAGIKRAFEYDTDILVESAVRQPRELEVAVLGDSHRPQISGVGEIVPDREFYSYESKYDAASTTDVVVPAAIDTALQQKIQSTAAAAYRALHCRGLARVDFLLAANGTLYVNEINTMPGFTNISMYPKLWQADGMTYQSLVMTLIDTAQ